MEIMRLEAVDLEETLTLRDELMMAYSLTSFDAAGKAVAVSYGSWGIVEAKTGQVFPEKDFQFIQIPLPRNGKIVATLALVEVDDYAQAQKTLATIRKYHDFIKVPAALAELADVALTPLKYLSLGLTAAGVGFQLADRLDADDILGQNSAELGYRKAVENPLWKVPLTFKDSHLKSSFHYELSYELRSQTVQVKRRTRPKS
ncbi:hypothetical protein GCM10007390_15830 [Persicitalea jodogahamensis]|uniref:Uncharacterized protein n=2 Tax=Persicitalea jodogahamensis TaxID=402147 RepID=A0A8J3D7U8_9BACT|nr:hypothetical protein GCM10007390_15830 [Persicitalea jodogahamensis]